MDLFNIPNIPSFLVSISNPIGSHPPNTSDRISLRSFGRSWQSSATARVATVATWHHRCLPWMEKAKAASMVTGSAASNLTKQPVAWFVYT